MESIDEQEFYDAEEHEQHSDDEKQTVESKYSEAKFMALLYCLEGIDQPKAAITERNQMFYVEVIRNLSEFVIYGEKILRKQNPNGTSYFDILCERNTLERFQYILSLNNRFVNMQLIQTSSIFLYNISQMTKKFYILSHPFLHKLITFPFNVYDEELIDIYMAFFKSLALQLNTETIKFFFNSRFPSFPFLSQALPFYNHPEMMVRNAIRIIALTVFKLNDDAVNRCLCDLPHAGYFVQLACQVRDKMIELDQSYQRKGVRGYEQLYHFVEEMQDQLEYLQEVFECDNRIVSDLLSNALLHYCYLPVVLGSLASEQKPLISISTAEFILIRTLHHIKYQPFVNTIVGALLLDKIPANIMRGIEVYPECQMEGYSYKWRHVMGVQYTPRQYIGQYFNSVSFESYVEQHASNKSYRGLNELFESISKEVDHDLKHTDRKQFSVQLLLAVQKHLTTEQFKQIEDEHLEMSKALGYAVGFTKVIKSQEEDLIVSDETECEQKALFDSYIDAQYTFMIELITKNNTEGSYYAENTCKRSFLQLLQAKDDGLVLLTCSLLYSILSISKTSPSLLFRANLYPIGLRRKNLLLQKLINTTEDSDLLDLNPKSKKAKPLNDRQANLQSLELDFQNHHLLDKCKSDILYDSHIIDMLITLLTYDPPFRIITFRLICTIICHLTFNKNFECSLRSEQVSRLNKAYGESIGGLERILRNPQTAEMVPEIIEEEWARFRFSEQLSEIEPLLEEPLLIVPVIDEKQAKRAIPQQLLLQIKDIEVVRMRIRGFFSLRHMNFMLTQNDGQSINQMKENPMKRDERETAQWQQGETYELTQECGDPILCNVRINQKMCVRYVLIDQEYFILIEPEYNGRQDESRVKVHIKQPLKHIESVIDKTEPRNLNFGYPVFTKGQSKPTIEEMMLYFENTHKCSLVKNKLDMSKKASKQILITAASGFLEKCLGDMRTDHLLFQPQPENILEPLIEIKESVQDPQVAQPSLNDTVLIEL
ncbi:hypothetical protein FGO68_gene16079 [Halteria grandinella]|uniref:FPL domain-containing protein n=1 Tax=Halteria grandinella TaxID=5974 RepID=A0A8J8T735_HALGN|nr:hypothetical protein FGO68_gene16079 [Halteria grandinella]